MWSKPLCYFPPSGKKVECEVNPLPGLHLAAWEEELGEDPDRHFLLEGIKNGFEIIDNDADISPASCQNHPSARPGSPLYAKATAQVLREIENGHYVICEKQPKIVSPMAAIPKPDGDVRLIHDCSRPAGEAVNDYCSTDWHQTFSRVDDAAAVMTEGCYFAKVDLRSAYRSVRLGKRSQAVTGLSWTLNGKTIFMKDTRLPFGARLSVGIFHRLTQAVKRMMARKGYDLTIVYLDDFLLVSESKEVCAEALQTLILLLRKLGFMIHWGKVVDPTTRITFLGIELDSVKMTLRLPEEKLLALREELRSSLSRNRFTKRQLQSLAGRLSWAASVVKGGRVFLRRIFNTIRALRHNAHRVRVTSEVRKDLLWWSNFVGSFNGRSTLLDRLPIECVFSDASNEGAGGSFGGDWFYLNWAQDWPHAAHFHINEKEVIAVTLAAFRWAPFWRNKRILIYSDSSVTVAAINKGTCRNDTVMKCIRNLFWLSATFNFHLTARHLPGIENTAADSASRLATPGHLETLWPYTDNSPLHLHMSHKTLFFLLNRFPRWPSQFKL